MTEGNKVTLYKSQQGQSMLEFALILPLMVLIVIGVFDLGRAFFAYIAISNAAREGARVYTFSPDKTTIDNNEMHYFRLENTIVSHKKNSYIKSVYYPFSYGI
jgi:Flp pilus assembly protein TadG